MAKSDIKNKCRQIRKKFLEKLVGRVSLDKGWLGNHIANCPRCQRRIIGLGKVDFAFSLLKSEPHKLDLLMRANSQAINVLKHSLRNAPKAEKLKKLRPEPKWHQRYSRQAQAVLSAAACVAVIVLLKVGVFSSMNSVQKHGKTVVKQYYVKHLGQEVADEIFTA